MARVRRLTVAAIGALVIASPVAAQTWSCKISPAEAPNATITERWEISGSNLLGYQDDFADKPIIYAVLQNTRSGVIAIRHDPKRAILVTIDLETGTFSQTEIGLAGTEERFKGSCTKR